MVDLNVDDKAMAAVLGESRTIAVVGHSDKPDRASYQIAQFLKQKGYRVYPVNPVVSEIDGQPCYPNLHAVPEAIDIVDVFRKSQYLPEIVDEAIAVGAKTVWGQSGVSDATSARKASDAGLNVAMDKCIKIEYARLNVTKR